MPIRKDRRPLGVVSGSYSRVGHRLGEHNRRIARLAISHFTVSRFSAYPGKRGNLARGKPMPPPCPARNSGNVGEWTLIGQGVGSTGSRSRVPGVLAQGRGLPGKPPLATPPPGRSNLREIRREAAREGHGGCGQNHSNASNIPTRRQRCSATEGELAFALDDTCMVFQQSTVIQRPAAMESSGGNDDPKGNSLALPLRLAS